MRIDKIWGWGWRFHIWRTNNFTLHLASSCTYSLSLSLFIFVCLSISVALINPNFFSCRNVLSPPGGSNGGMLVGNMYIQRPDLFGAVSVTIGLCWSFKTESFLYSTFLPCVSLEFWALYCTLLYYAAIYIILLNSALLYCAWWFRGSKHLQIRWRHLLKHQMRSTYRTIDF